QQKSIMYNWSEAAEKKTGGKLAFSISAALIAIIVVLGLRSWKLNKEIVQRKKMSQELIWRQANFDSLTQLPNRHMFHERLTHELQRSDRTGMPLALLFLDLDHFKEVNDSLGHGMGDILLVEAANRLKSCVRAIDTVARLGGDEFIVILSAMQESADVEVAAQKILSRMAEPFQLHNEMVYISASIGITMYPEDATDAEILLKNADQAMYAAKSLGRNCLHYFTYAIQEAAKTKRHIANELRVAVAEQQFHLLYQPIVELASGNIHKAEALIRWRHPERGLINPGQFISVAEATGLIIPIGNWIFYEVAAQVAKWRALLHPDFQISVNTSPIQFKNNENFQDWIEHMQGLGLPGQNIVIEITEGLLLEKNTAVKFQLSEFRNAGIQIAIDDFGTGYSSLSYLKKFDVDYVKIDRSFISNLTGESDDMALCEAIISMAHKLDLKVVAEGIETAEQQSLLIKAGCDYGQGYFFAQPLHPLQLESFIKESMEQ
ncbi:MAG TPA: EAL domain-containing protein, partial [Methylophilaceae bacterium]|nr:EAL domain-containing protein [Methylophilaceae bacterium]